MATTIEVTGGGSFRGSKSSLTDFGVQESITPLNAAQPGGGVGTISFGATENVDSLFLLDNGVELNDGARGQVLGTVRSLSSTDFGLQVTADSILSLLKATRTAEAFAGTLENLITYYLGLVNVTTDFLVDAGIGGRTVLVGGWHNTLLEGFTDLCVAEQIEMSVVYDQIVFRPARANVAVTTRESTRSVSVGRGSPAKAVEIYHYNYEPITNTIVYPNVVETTRNSFQVNPNETLETTRLEMSASLTSVNQPTAAVYLAPDYTGSTSQYVVLGNDDLPIPVAEWNSKGGLVSVSIDPEDTHFLLLDVTGMDEPDDIRAPYRVGVLSSGGSTYYNAFYITGTGVMFDKTKNTFYTGATNTEVEVGVTIDNPLISTYPQALTAVQKAVTQYSGVNHSVSGSAVSINRTGTSGEVVTSKLVVFDTEFVGLKLSALDAKGWLFADFDAHYAALVPNKFQNQAFGNVSGARVLRNEAWFRVDSATITPATLNYNASQDTLGADWDLVWAGRKLVDWDTAWAGLSLKDFSLKPLKVGV